MKNASPSSRGRGLKFSLDFAKRTGYFWSPSSRGRGLKYRATSGFASWTKVALFTRAWIEMICTLQSFQNRLRRHLHEGVDWNSLPCADKDRHIGRPLHEGVDWNTLFLPSTAFKKCRPLHEGVDWNVYHQIRCVIYHESPSSRGRGLK